MKTGRLEAEHLTQCQSQLIEAKGLLFHLLTPRPDFALPCAALMGQQGLGEQDKGCGTGLSVTWSHREERSSSPGSQGREGGCVCVKGDCTTGVWCLLPPQ